MASCLSRQYLHVIPQLLQTLHYITCLVRLGKPQKGSDSVPDAKFPYTCLLHMIFSLQGWLSGIKNYFLQNHGKAVFPTKFYFFKSVRKT